MSSASNDQGRAYEYIWINILHDVIKPIRKVCIVDNSSLLANKRAWNQMNETTKSIFSLSASSAVSTIIELEPKMIENTDEILTLEFQQDGAGTNGDVRDIVAKLNDSKWEIGLSIKHNHEAIKHSRLSHKLDFGKEWFKIPCSEEYWNEICPIFSRLINEKNNNVKWSDLENKESTVYIPLLNAFINEVKRSYNLDNKLPKKMVEYLIGIKDYYKIVSMDNKKLTMIHSFNIHKTLNKPSKIKVSTITIPVVNLPTELVTIKMKKERNNTVEMYLNNGWQLSFRIHNASTFVEPSLKFDIQFIGMPTSILNIECKWK